MKTKFILIAIISTVVLFGCTFDKGEAVKPMAALTPCEMVSYRQHIDPIMQSNCVGCHNSGFTGYDLSNYEGVKAKVDNGSFTQRVLIIKDMPGYCILPDSVVQNIQCWLNNGAPNN